MDESKTCECTSCRDAEDCWAYIHLAARHSALVKAARNFRQHARCLSRDDHCLVEEALDGLLAQETQA